MLAVQKPVALFSSPQAHLHRPSHSRHPSAPVVIRPTQTPGLLSLSKPAQPQQRQQQPQQHARAPRSSPKGKQQRSPQPAPAQAQAVEDGKKAKASRARAVSPSDKSSKPANAPSAEKSPRGRQSAKSSSPKEKADKRSPSNSRAPARRLSHQPSPSPPARIPKQSESTTRPPVNPLRAQSFTHRDSDSNLFDPFVSTSTSDNESSESASAVSSQVGPKPLSYRTPHLDSRPTGKLAHRRQFSHVNGSPTPTQAVPVLRGQKPTSTTTVSTPKRRGAHPVVSVLPLAEWDSFPVCDEMSPLSSPTTPVHESASYPTQRSAATWQQALLDDAPRSAPLSAAFEYPFAAPPAFSTPSPASRRRHHRRVPSEGVFAMSTDEESSSESADELKNVLNKLVLGGQRPAAGSRTPSPPAMDGTPAGFYAGSVFQNSPSPDDLPVPAFRA